MAFTTDEIQAAVEQLVRTSVRRPYDDTGVRRNDITFSDMNDAAAGVYVLYPNALYYTIKLCTDKLAKTVEANQDLLTSFMQYVSAVGRHVNPVTSLNVLANARVALQELASASSTREDGFKSVTDTSAYARFNENTQRFLDEVGGTVKSGGDIVPTPDEARAQFAGAYRDVQEGFVDVVTRAGYLARAVEDFDSMSLPATLFGSIANNSVDLLKSEYDKLSALTPEERLAVIRNTILNVLATRSTIKGFGNLSSPGMFYELDGMGGPYADASYPPVHASVTGDQYGPFNILGTANELDLRLDGATSITTTVRVQPSFVPFIEGTVKEDYTFTSTPPSNLIFSLGLKNWPTVGTTTLVNMTFPDGSIYDAYEASFDINTAINLVDPAMPLLAEPYCNPLRYTGNFDIAIASPIECTFTAVNPTAVDFPALGVTVGDFIIVRDPTCLVDRAIFKINLVNTSDLKGLRVHGSLTTETNKTCQLSNGALAMRLRITDHTDSNISKPDYRLQSLIDRVSVYLPQQGAGTVDDQFYSCTTLGFVPVMDAVARPTPASEVVLTYNAQPGAAVAGVARTMATAVFDPIVYEGAGRTNPYDPVVFVAYKYQATCDMSDGGTTISFNCMGAATAGVAVGDTLVIRSSVTPGVVNYPFLVMAVDDSSITVAGTIPAGETGVSIEVGPTFTRADILDAALMVSGNTPNDGEYVIRSQGTIPFELTVNNRISVPYGVGNLPVTCTLAIGRHVMKFESLKEDLTARIYMSTEANPASAFSKFFSVDPQNAYGTTVYYKPPSLPKGLAEGDLLELYVLNLSPSYTGVITKIDSTTGVIELDTAMPVNTASMTFTKDSPVPFARIRRQHTDNYAVFSEALMTWLDGLNLDTDFMNLTRALNALIVNANPTPSQVNAARAELTNLNNVLLDLSTILATYEAPVVQQVDALVKSFKEKGADRSVDILLSCRFSDFFGLTQDGSGYTSYVQSAIKEVANNDLPIRKFDRLTKNKVEQALLASWDEQDFEFSKGDADPEQPYDPPGTSDFLVTPR